jgi:LacI family transcriptional regulator
MNPRIKGVTMKQIAERAGVSTTAVSMALKNHPRLLPATCKRIQELARDMGYVPNPMVSALMSQVALGRVVNQGVVVGVLIDRQYNPDENTDPDSYFNTIYHGALKRLEELGCSHEKFVFSDSQRYQRRLDQILKARGITGILLPSVYEVGSLPDIDFARTAVVTSGYSIPATPIHRVVPDQFGAMKLALRELRRRGYQRPAFMTLKKLDERINGLEYAAFLSECIRYFPGIDAGSAVGLDESWDKHSLARLLQRCNPDVVISNYSAVENWLGELGLNVPEDIGFLRLGRYGNPAQSHTDLNGDVIGSWMVDLLTASLNRNEIGLPPWPKRLVVPPKFVDGFTLKPVAP